MKKILRTISQFILVVISTTQAFPFEINHHCIRRAYHEKYHHSATTQSDADTIILTEEAIFQRNQGFLTMKSINERYDAWKRLNSTTHIYNDDSQHTLPNYGQSASYYNPQVDKDGFGAILMEKGVVRIDGVISPACANTMISYVDRLLIETNSVIEEGIFPFSSLFGTVHQKENRWDLLLPLEASEYVMSCLSELLHEKSKVAMAIESVLGKDAELYELSTMISDPGATQQPLHPDILYQDTMPPILTCFVALQDIDSDMGPTLFMPGSATKEYHEDLENRHLDPNAVGLVATSYNELATLKIGDCSLYSSLILHSGGANKSSKRRRLFYVSFRNNAVFREGCRTSSSIRPELKSRLLTLRSIQDMIKNRNTFV